MKPRHLISGILLALLLAYPLSLGPAVKWTRRHPETQYHRTIVAFYLPLSFICVHVPLARKVMERYVALWAGPSGTNPPAIEPTKQ
jgi:hypothetical protein